MKNRNSSKLSRTSFVLNIVLAVLYVPLALFSFLLFMVSEITIGAADQTYVLLVMIFCWISLAVPLLCAVCLICSAILRRREKVIAALSVQLLPLAVFVLNLVYLFLVDGLYLL